jgi:hypothetical protein
MGRQLVIGGNMRCILRNGELGITFELLFFTKLKLRNKLLN